MQGTDKKRTLIKNIVNRIKFASTNSEFTDYFESFRNIVLNEQKNLKMNEIREFYEEFLMNLLFNSNLIHSFQTHQRVLDFFKSIKENECFKEIIRMKFVEILNQVIDKQLDIPHLTLIYLIKYLNDEKEIKTLINKIIKEIYQTFHHKYKEQPHYLLKKERSLKFLINLIEEFRGLINFDEHVFLKKGVVSLENEILNCQKIDIERDLSELLSEKKEPIFNESISNKIIKLRAPLRLGLSSANASDNHTRSKEKGGRALNVSIDIESEINKITPPINLKIEMLEKHELIIESKDLSSTFHLNNFDPRNYQEFFKFREGEDDELRLLKAALVQVGIIKENGKDPLKQLISFTKGKGLKLSSNILVPKGTGLGTSSILAASLLKILYKITNEFDDYDDDRLFTESIALEHYIGLNSGWQDAQGAMTNGFQAIKTFFTEPSISFPSPSISYINLNQDDFEKRIILFYTGISRRATSKLNVVLNAYLSRNPVKYLAIKNSYLIHEKMIISLKNEDYESFGGLLTRYWNLRVKIDPSASNKIIEFLFKKLFDADLIDGGSMSGAGGGGFAILVSKNGKENELRTFLKELNLPKSRIYNYKLNVKGIELEEFEKSS
ncbi:MAG: GHMP family kinase ATP-binding protein [Candidatus Helarchaeota archaeon]